MLFLDLIAEQRIAEAIARGELSNLPGEGRPLDLDDDSLVPEDLRMAYRILKNAGFVPPEVEAMREIADVERLISALAEGEQRSRARLKLQLLQARLDASGLRQGPRLLADIYTRKILDRLGRSEADCQFGTRIVPSPCLRSGGPFNSCQIKYLASLVREPSGTLRNYVRRYREVPNNT